MPSPNLNDKAIERKVKRWMRQNIPEVMTRGGFVPQPDATSMAEDACHAFDLYDGDEIPEELFEWSHDVCEQYEKENP